jgi:hypothetical protein
VIPETGPHLDVDQLLMGEQDGVELLALSHEASGAGFVIQRAGEVDDQDIGTGKPACCLCDAAGRTHHGGQDSFKVTGHTLTLEFDAHAARVFEYRRSFSGSKTVCAISQS